MVRYMDEVCPVGDSDRLVVGLTGLAGSGKSTVASLLADRYGFVVFGFADAMRDALLTLDPMLSEHMRLRPLVSAFGWDKVKRTYPEARRLLQVFGTDVVRALDPQFWVTALDRKLSEHPEAKRVVVADVRFDNEAEWVHSLGDRSRVYMVQRDVERMAHTSESGIRPDLLSGVIDNRRSLAELAEMVEALHATW